MEKFNVYASRLLPKDDFLCSGHRACQGCAEALALRLVHKGFGRNTIAASATGCMEIISSPYPETAWNIPWIHVAFENSASVGSGVEAALKVLQRKGRIPKRKINVVAYGGDGATADIGLQWVSGAMERGHNMTYVCYDNEAYMNTGIQRSSSTPLNAATTTSPAGRKIAGQQTWKKNMPQIMAAHNIPYVATLNPSYPFDFMRKVEKAKSIDGPCYLHVYSCCPTGWGSRPELGIQLGRLAVETGAFPLYEVEYGKTSVQEKIEEFRPLKDYLKLQRRFRHLTDDMVAVAESRLRQEYQFLLDKEEMTKEGK